MLLVVAASSLSGCVTAWTVYKMGKDLDRYVVDMKAWQLDGKLVFEATTASITDPPKPKDRYYWTEIKEDVFFSTSSYDWNSLAFSPGSVPQRVLRKTKPLEGCIAAGKSSGAFIVHDTCGHADRETKVNLKKEVDYSHSWRMAALPVAVPVAVVTDIALIPVYAGYAAYCALSKDHCPK